MTDQETEIQPAGSGYYLIYIGKEQYRKAKEALNSAGVSLEYRCYTELGHNRETHCTIAAVEGLLTDALNGQMEEEGLEVKPEMTWEEMREVAEFYANDDGWTGNYEADAETFRSTFPHLVKRV